MAQSHGAPPSSLVGPHEAPRREAQDAHGHETHVHEADGPQAHTRSSPHGAPEAFTIGEARQARRLGAVLWIVVGFFVLELAGAIVADSVVLQADALHLLTDVLALGVSSLAMRLAVRRPTPRFTYGLRRAEPVAAIFSAVLVLLTTVGIVIEGIAALHERTPPKAGVMLMVASMALLVNGLSAWLLHDAIRHRHPHDETSPGPAPAKPHGHGENAAVVCASKAPGHALNLRGAWLHLVGDTLGAFAALCAALIIRFGGSPAADPIASFVVAAILLYGSVRLLRDATLVLLEAAPAHLPVGTIRRLAADFPGVVAVHDLHAWSLGAGHDAITLHVRARDRDPELAQKLSDRIRGELEVEYVTVQVDLHDDPCGQRDEED
jgi:cobalt-zinc-cadmium efflux system protein